MNEAVIDASALAAVAFAEADGDEISQHLERHLLHAPDLLFLELASVAWKKSRRAMNPRMRALIAEQFETSLHLKVTLHPVMPAEVLRIGLASDLSVHDAAYFGLAQHLRLPLITLDRRLQAAMDSLLP